MAIIYVWELNEIQAKEKVTPMPTGLPPLSPLFPKVTPKSCLKGFPACHRNHSGTHSIDVVSNCSCGQWFRLSCLTMELCIH